mmetsp:Transcript_40867/g.130535  ORF Transcript_40867/g.130535 Transcript_40867/m.130535 type:complete len:245 (+) Transcript_40867:234-968(+)|eukprot:CAMPEP_0182904356 /NCGR_PEP_ID=MMETSP0034_2-20130328/32053_1 /TAXON_ID=156128 /ORGANISM="Nephroselmis pyriformis, Strain CCMP717" /LENGTH=244 /DNA_ID=CAMNT_0025039501 /DNA_START=61 /DNA_END=795 /DNA_ORIENTATION=+
MLPFARFASRRLGDVAARVAASAGGVQPAASAPAVRRAWASAASGGQMSGACVLERYPVVHEALPDWEVEYQEWREKWNAHKYLVLPENFGMPDKANPGAEGGESKWEPADVVTDDDRSNNRKSLYRRLDTKLFLIVQDSAGKWKFPDAVHEAGEPMRGTAERAIGAAVDPEVRRWFVGNPPAGHLEGVAGGTVFFHRAQLLNNCFDNIQLASGSGYKDHLFVAKDEFGEYFDDEWNALLQKML